MNTKILDTLNQIFLSETAGVVRYLHYSFMIMGYNRIPIQKWFRDQAMESMNHAILVGEKITALGGHPPMMAGKSEETNHHGIQQILNESLKFEMEGLALYKKLAELAAAEGDIAIEEMARTLVREETDHIDEVQKMLRQPA